MSMLRSRLSDALKDAMKSKDERALTTVRLIMAALKDRDIAARGKGNTDGISEDDILSMLQSMVKQRHESIKMYEDGNRPELAQREAEEITVIKRFLPAQLSDGEMAEAIKEVLSELEASTLKDMGPVMAALKERCAGRMDFAKASALVKEKLA